MTSIYGVEYWITEKYNGKDAQSFKESKNVVAKNAQDAIDKMKAMQKDYSYTEEEKGKKIKVTRSEFDPINVILRASTD